VQREGRKADLFVKLAHQQATPEEFVARMQSLSSAHELHLDSGLPDVSPLLRYLPSELLQKADH
jgi:hypothetical protein